MRDQIKLFLLLLSLHLLSCNSLQNDPKVVELSDSSYIDLPDSLFSYSNIENSDFLKEIDWGVRCYTDSTKTKELIKLDSLAIAKLLLPVNAFDSSTFPPSLETFYYISKQPKVGDVQPIIIWGSGDDFSELMLLTLDKKNKPIDSYSLSEFCFGMDELGDTLVALCPRIRSLVYPSKIIK